MPEILVNRKRLLITLRYPWRLTGRRWKVRGVRRVRSLYLQAFALEIVMWF